mgnify:FL=1
MQKKFNWAVSSLLVTAFVTGCATSNAPEGGNQATSRGITAPTNEIIFPETGSPNVPYTQGTSPAQVKSTSAQSSAQPTPSRSTKSGLANRKDVQAFADRVARNNNLDRDWVLDILSRTELKPKIVEAMNRPAEGMIWGQYRPIFITDKRINDGVKFYHTHQKALERAYNQYGVAPEVIAAIIGVETSYGQNRGNWAVLDALATLAFDYPRRAEFFSKELENFFVILNETKLEPFSYKGSYAGAMGFPQFMPSSYLAYAVDFDGDGLRDLWNNPVDAIGSVANYLAKHGWVQDGTVALEVKIPTGNTAHLQYKHTGRLVPPKYSVATLKAAGVQTYAHNNNKANLFEFEMEKNNPAASQWWLGFQNFYSITRYNHSPLYALAVHQLAEGIKARK